MPAKGLASMTLDEVAQLVGVTQHQNPPFGRDKRAYLS